MIKQEKVGLSLVHTYSSNQVWIQNAETNQVYMDAIDVEPVPPYIETNIPITQEDTNNEQAY